MKIALQLYSIREDAARDLLGCLRQLKSWGYDGVELAGFYNHNPAEFKQMLDEVGLIAISAHVPMEEIFETFDDYKVVGCEYIAIPWLSGNQAPGGENFAETMKNIEKIGKAAKEAGLMLLYHNHDFEFRKIDGKYGLDVMYDSIPADVLGVQPDTCWIKVAGVDPAEYVKKYAGRVPLVHLKDFILGTAKTGAMYQLIGNENNDLPSKEGFDYRPLGQGLQDIPSIIEAAKSAGTEWLIIEQDESTTCPPLEAAKTSMEFINSIFTKTK